MPQLSPPGLVGCYHHQRPVGILRQQHGVGDRQHGRAVDEHKVELRTQRREYGLRGRAVQQLGRVGGKRSRAEHPKGFLPVHPLHGLHQRPFTEQHRGEPRLLVEAKELPEPGSAQVARHHDHPLTRLGEDHAKIRDGRGLALCRAWTGHH